MELSTTQGWQEDSKTDSSSTLGLLGKTDAEQVVTQVHTCKLWYVPRREYIECSLWEGLKHVWRVRKVFLEEVTFKLAPE